MNCAIVNKILLRIVYPQAIHLYILKKILMTEFRQVLHVENPSFPPSKNAEIYRMAHSVEHKREKRRAELVLYTPFPSFTGLTLFAWMYRQDRREDMVPFLFFRLYVSDAAKSSRVWETALINQNKGIKNWYMGKE